MAPHQAKKSVLSILRSYRAAVAIGNSNDRTIFVDVDDGLMIGWRDGVAAWAASKERIREVYLFGSRAKGGFTAGESDVDIAYILTGNDAGEKLAYSMFECGDWGHELQQLLDVSLDLQFTDYVDDLEVWRWVREHGQLIYRKPGCGPLSD